jgi:hypothetical protein
MNNINNSSNKNITSNNFSQNSTTIRNSPPTPSLLLEIQKHKLFGRSDSISKLSTTTHNVQPISDDRRVSKVLINTPLNISSTHNNTSNNQLSFVTNDSENSDQVYILPPTPASKNENVNKAVPPKLPPRSLSMTYVQNRPLNGITISSVQISSPQSAGANAEYELKSNDSFNNRSRSQSTGTNIESANITPIQKKVVVTKEEKSSLKIEAKNGDFASMCKFAMASDPSITKNQTTYKEAITWYIKAREAAKIKENTEELPFEFSYGELSYLLARAYINKPSQDRENAYLILKEGVQIKHYKCTYEMAMLFLDGFDPNEENLDPRIEASNLLNSAIKAANAAIEAAKEEMLEEEDQEEVDQLKIRIQTAQYFIELAKAKKTAK